MAAVDFHDRRALLAHAMFGSKRQNRWPRGGHSRHAQEETAATGRERPSLFVSSGEKARTGCRLKM
ncbi:MAG: hypothetical protein WA184_20630, partial [Stellaceae bacterium]